MNKMNELCEMELTDRGEALCPEKEDQRSRWVYQAG